MTAAEYREKAEEFRREAERPWTLRETRAHLLLIAEAYEKLAQATENIARSQL
jgi:hypothetical protein